MCKIIVINRFAIIIRFATGLVRYQIQCTDKRHDKALAELCFDVCRVSLAMETISLAVYNCTAAFMHPAVSGKLAG